MNTQLKKAIIDYVFENENEFQLVNNTVSNFRAYIYDNDGKYLIGGENVSDFIQESINLITK